MTADPIDEQRHAQLRQWARGLYPVEAGTELLIRAFDGRFARNEHPWIRDNGGRSTFFVDFDRIPDHIGHYSGGEQRVLRIAAALGSDTVSVNLAENVTGLDRPTLQLVLAAIAHAGGTHEHAGYAATPDERHRSVRLGSLSPWPGDPTQTPAAGRRL